MKIRQYHRNMHGDPIVCCSEQAPAQALMTVRSPSVWRCREGEGGREYLLIFLSNQQKQKEKKKKMESQNLKQASRDDTNHVHVSMGLFPQSLLAHLR